MLKYNCIVIDDERHSAEVLKDHISQVPFLELKQICGDAMGALEILQQIKIDLIFLDIDLPRLQGLDFLDSLKAPPRVIITTASSEHAIRAFELNVMDYLLKPISFIRFLKAVNKLHQQIQVAIAHPIGKIEERPYLFVNVAKKKVKVYLDEICYVESLREYVRITTRDSSIMTKFQLNELESLFPQNKFIRVHRSFIVSQDRIAAYSSTDVEINGTDIPIGRTYKDYVLSLLDSGKMQNGMLVGFS